MKRTKDRKRYFSRLETSLWTLSAAAVLVSFALFGGSDPLTPVASLVGVTSILLSAKGNPLGQLLMILFSLLYGYLSYGVAYYGEMATYLGMTMPMAVLALISWLRHPYQGNRSEVAVNRIGKGEAAFMLLLTAAVTAGFYFLLREWGTARLAPGTLSVATSFLAVYLTFRRSPWFSLAYAANDGVLLLLWSLASREDLRYVPVPVCFAVFLLNDVYAFISWMNMAKRQQGSRTPCQKGDPAL